MRSHRTSLPELTTAVCLIATILSACSDSRVEESSIEGAIDDDLPAGVTFRVRGHREIVVQEDGSLRPRWFGPEREVGVCLDVPLSIDSSQWRVQLRFDGTPAGDFLEPNRQAGTALCFERKPPPNLASSLDLEVCGRVHDGFEDRHYDLPCFRAVYDAGGSEYEAEISAFRELVQRRLDLSRERRLVEIDAHADDLTARGFPLLATKLRLVTISDLSLEGPEPESLAEIRRRLSALPTWVDQPEAAVVAVSVASGRANLELTEGRMRRAWELLRQAEELARGVAAPERVAIVTEQANILARMGAGAEAIARLRTVLADCDRWPCHPALEPAAHGLLGWLLLLDPDAGPQDLEEAMQALAAAAGDSHAGDHREPANRLLNTALLAARRGRDSGLALRNARAILRTLDLDAHTRYLLAWADVIEGLAALGADDPGRALEHCQAAAFASTQATAWAWSCVGQAYRLRDERQAAAMAFDQAVLHHALATPESGSERPPAPGQRVDDYYRAARIAIERDDPQRAWQLLEALDHLSVDVFTACEGESDDTRRQLERRRQELLSQLAWTEPPLAPERRRQVAPVRHSLLLALDELQRELLSSCRRPLRPTPVAADLRAFALPDEVLLLRRSGARITVARKTAISRLDLRQQIDQLAVAQSKGMSDDAWRTLARPLADALLPPNSESLSEVTHFALHGLLQRIPLAALPVESPGGARWLSELTTAVLRPSFVEETTFTSAGSDTGPLFVVDPRRNLPSGRAARDSYRKRFPEAHILFGPEATDEAVRAALPAASFLHIDAHGHYDAAFPELSGLELSDGDLTLADFVSAASPRLFVNLSACHTGGAAQTGDSGRYGLAGALARSGTRWVIASQGAIEDPLSHDFNETFYHEIHRGSTVVEAFRAALDGVRNRHGVASWSNLIILGGGDEGQNRPGAD